MPSDCDIQGYDIDASMIETARANAKLAGVDSLIHFQVRDVAALSHSSKYGFIITNPPYGERLEEKEALYPLYRTLATRYKALNDWSMYVIAVVEAVLENKRIESHVSARIFGNDSCAGFEEGWVKMLDLNKAIAPKGAEELITETVEQIKDGKIHVFKGDYLGVNPDDPSDTWDLNTEYPENEKASAPSFHYILKDVITVEEPNP